jgi:hypothetical protein
MNKKLPKYELNQVDENNWFYLFECDHITNGTFPPENVIPIGEHTNFLLCKHCWNHIIGMVTTQLLNEALKQQILETRSKLWSRPHNLDPNHDKIEM